MGFSLSDQTAYFLWSIVFGMALAALYDLLRAVRMLTKARRTAVILTDILFFMLCGVLTSLFALPFNKGSVRAFIIFGESAGFLSYRLTAGSIMGKFYSRAAVILRRFVQKIHKIIQVFFDLLLKMTSSIVYNVNVLIELSFRKATDTINKHRSSVRTRSRTKRKDIYNEQRHKNKHKRKDRKIR